MMFGLALVGGQLDRQEGSQQAGSPHRLFTHSVEIITLEARTWPTNGNR